MRTREKSYADYGVTNDDCRKIKQFCENANEEEKQIIKYALSELEPYVSFYVFESLVKNKSYEEISSRDYLYIGKGDFYGYRRQGMAAVKRWMMLYRIWESDE